MAAEINQLSISQPTGPGSVWVDGHSQWLNSGHPVNAAESATAAEIVAAILDPEAPDADAAKGLFDVSSGVYLQLRANYEAGITITQQPVVRVYGVFLDGSTQLLENVSGDTDITLTCYEASDDQAPDGASFYSRVANNTHVWPLMGCKRVLVYRVTNMASDAETPPTLCARVIS